MSFQLPFAGAQCAHAAVGLVEKLNNSREAAAYVLLRQWEECGQAKVCLKAQDSQQLVSGAILAPCDCKLLRVLCKPLKEPSTPLGMHGGAAT
jgi:hypothetical protein